MNNLNTLYPLITKYAQYGIYVCEDLQIKKHLQTFATDIQNALTFLHNNTNCYVYQLEAEEKNKNIETVITIWDFLLSHGASQKSLLVSIGGGITSDICAFVASTFNRGMPFAIIPTTLLSVIDASIGGKGGFNFRGLKNYIGVFYSPIAIFQHTGFLKTLPTPHLLSGFAEMFKTALLDSDELFNKTINAFLQIFDDNISPISDDISLLLQRIINVKERYVKTDMYDKNSRHALNLGHTIGHAIEEYSLVNDKTPLLHGYAVMLGLLATLYISSALYNIKNDYLLKLTDIAKKFYKLPWGNCKMNKQVIQFIAKDKKISLGDNTENEYKGFVVLKTIGHPQIDVSVSHQLVEEAIDFVFSL